MSSFWRKKNGKTKSGSVKPVVHFFLSENDFQSGKRKKCITYQSSVMLLLTDLRDRKIFFLILSLWILLIVVQGMQDLHRKFLLLNSIDPLEFCWTLEHCALKIYKKGNKYSLKIKIFWGDISLYFLDIF